MRLGVTPGVRPAASRNLTTAPLAAMSVSTGKVRVRVIRSPGMMVSSDSRFGSPYLAVQRCQQSAASYMGWSLVLLTTAVTDGGETSVAGRPSGFVS